MRDWLSSLASERVPEIIVGLALGYAAVGFAERIVGVPISILAQHFGRRGADAPELVLGLVDLTSPYYLNFSIGDTVVAYGPVLASTLALGLVALTAWFVVRRRDRALGECPFCASRIPHASTRCAYCGSGLTPAEL